MKVYQPLRVRILAALFGILSCGVVFAEENAVEKSWVLGQNDIQVAGKPIQFRSGEISPYRIPREKWESSMQLVKAAGLNAVTVNVLWNMHEKKQGVWDFSTDRLDLAAFLQLAKKQDLAVILRVGPYVGAEADLGGLPSYVLMNPNANLRHYADKAFLADVSRYIKELGEITTPFLSSNQGPVMMIQVENRYGSYGEDPAYLAFVRDQLLKNGFDVPLSTSDDALEEVLEKGTMPGCAVGLDSGYTAVERLAASKIRPEVPNFISAFRPGLRNSWGEQWSAKSDAEFTATLDEVLASKQSFTISPFLGGTQFGLSAGASAQGKGRYQANITSAHNGALVDEQGRPTKKFEILRQKLQALSPDRVFPEVPASTRLTEIQPFEVKPFSSIWEELKKQPVVADQPKSFEELGQFHQGIVIYSSVLPHGLGGELDFGDSGVRDYSQVYLEGKWIGKLDRSMGETKIELPKTSIVNPRLDIVVEAMGHLSEGTEISQDRKGLVNQVRLADKFLKNWAMYPISLDREGVTEQKASDLPADRSGYWFKGTCEILNVDDTYMDLANFQKGYVWVNGHLLGRYWNIGPQQRLFCPKSFMKKGNNEVVVLDLFQKTAAPVRGVTTIRP